ncbi:hypothetical protein KBC04_00180 [Candidatus Babeliales bacterium]|nr:hypothetical protein [Candidatus Babeliales bacterium]MBP9843492.1 hypothetical protein [Candidatus Babeliales bacterium]
MITLKQVSLSMVIIAYCSAKAFGSDDKSPFAISSYYVLPEDARDMAEYRRSVQQKQDLLSSLFSDFSAMRQPTSSHHGQASEFQTSASQYFNEDSSLSSRPWQKPCDEQARNAYKQHLKKQALLKLQSDVDQIRKEMTELKAEVQTGFSNVKSSMAMILYSVTQIEASLEKNNKQK